MKSDTSMDRPIYLSGELRGDQKIHVERAGSPVRSCWSMKSDTSMDRPIYLSGESRGDQRIHMKRAGSPVRSCWSMKSDTSMDRPIYLSGELRGDQKIHVERAGSPVPSCLSMKSDTSMDRPIYLSKELRGDQKIHVERAGSSVPSCLSMKSDTSMDRPIYLSGELQGDQSTQEEGSSVPGCQSARSANSIIQPINFRGKFPRDSRVQQPQASSSVLEMGSEMLPFRKQSLLRTLMKLKKNEKLKLFQSHLSQGCPECFNCLPVVPSVMDKVMMMKELFKSQSLDYPECSEGEQEDPEALYMTEKMLETFGSETSLRITLHILRNMKQKDFTGSTENDEQNDKLLKRAQPALKTHLQKKFECIFEGLAKQGHPTLLNEIYTELYITEAGSGWVNNEHEVRQIETASKRQTSQEMAILCNDIFKPLSGPEKHIRTVLTKGIAGIGKTVSVQKFILDWAEGKANQGIDFIFTLPFRDLNLKKRRTFSLMQLLQHYFPQLKKIKSIEGAEVVFIFDGLDECRLPLDFQSNEICCDITEASSVDVLLTNLIKGNLLPSALLWITSRPAAANQIPPECVHLVTEVRGFDDPQKEEYFRKRIKDQDQANRIIAHIKSSRSLHIMCHIPVFCWISASVLETMLDKVKSGDLPKTLTEMYTHFLLIQTNVKNQKYFGANETHPEKSVSDTEIILKLGQLAFLQLEKGNLVFYEEDLRESGIDVSEASVYCGVCTEIFKEERGLHQEKVYCFVHLSIQEYLAALFVFHSCVNENKDVLRAGKRKSQKVHLEEDDSDFEHTSDDEDEEEKKADGDRVQLSDLHRTAVNQALQSKNGHLDLFVRFLLGLSLDSIQNLLAGLLKQSRALVPDPQTQTGSEAHEGSHKPNLIFAFFQRFLTWTESTSPVPGLLTPSESRSVSIEKTAQYIKEKIREESSAERTINLFHCLSELNDNSLVEEIQNSLRSGKLSDKTLEPGQCSALAFVLLMSEEILDEFDLKTYNTSAAGHQRLVPVVRNCRKAILSSCDLTEKSYDIVVLAVKSPNSSLIDLDLTYNNLGDSVVELLCAGLMSPNCKLQRLGLGWCNLTEGCCDVLASVLRSPHSELRDLELRDNELQDSGVRALSAGLEDPHCKLQRLGLTGCGVTQSGCEYLASALHSNPSHLRELDLRYNHPGDSGVRALSAAKLDTLTLLVDNEGENRTKPGPRKYGCRLTLDPNTANRNLCLSEGNRRVTDTPGREEQPYPNHPERFEHWRQVVSRESVPERCYWEAEFLVPEEGAFSVAVACKEIGRKGGDSDCVFGWNKNSWSLECFKHSYSVWHNKNQTHISASSSPDRRGSDGDDGGGECVYRVGVCVDRTAGALSFYSVSDSDTLTLLHRFHTHVTEHTALCAGFGVWSSSMSLCLVE